jgi:hypothetical protein
MDAFRCRPLILAFLVVVFALAVAAPGAAQPLPWPMPDGYDPAGGCCQPAQPTLPPFPAVTQQIKFICWNNCNPQFCVNICVSFGVPAPLVRAGVVFDCGLYLIPITIRTCAANPVTLWSGRLLATYSRTWLEDAVPDPAGAPDHQIWRFLVNGDLRPSTFLLQNFGNNICVVPPCHAAFQNLVYWFGYIDYRNDCATGRWTVEWAIDHECDRFHHNADSARPAPVGAVFHPQHSYNFVGPSSFVCTINIPCANFQSPPAFEAVRSLIWQGVTQPPICLRRDRLTQFGIVPFQDLCVCAGPPPNPLQYSLSEFFGMSGCGTGFNIATQPKPFIQKKLGFFPDAAGNPFKFLCMNMGDVNYFDVCTMLTTNEYFEGVETIGGFPKFTVNGTPLPFRQFIDDGSSNFVNNARRKGILHVVSKIINANAP